MGAKLSKLSHAASSPPSTSLDGLGDPKNGGALFILPREVRDEIYRLVVKGFYVWPGGSDHMWSEVQDFWTFYSSTSETCLSILQVSKAINYEASEIWLSESEFEIVMDINRAIDVPPTNLTDFAKVVNILFTTSSNSFTGNYGMKALRTDYIKEVIAPFTRTHTTCKHLSLWFKYTDRHNIRIDKYLRKVFEACKLLTSFRTVDLRIDTFDTSGGPGPDFNGNVHEWFSVAIEKIEQEIEQLGQETKTILGHLLGPAKMLWDGDEMINFTFHPLQYSVDKAKQQAHHS